MIDFASVLLSIDWSDSEGSFVGSSMFFLLAERRLWRLRFNITAGPFVIYDVLFVRPCGDVDRFKVILVYLKR